jgi:hypothetical protein
MAFLRRYWPWLALGIVVLALFIPNPLSRVVKQAVKFLSRGKAVNANWPYNKKSGLVEAEPEGLAEEAGVSLDVFALATMLSSEHGNDPQVYKEAVGSVALNEARRRGVSITDLLLTVVNPSHAGFFGSQADMEKTTSKGGHAADRYASTARAPYEDDIGIAKALIAGETPDPTGGALQFDSPRAQDAGFKKGLYSMDANALKTKRESEGKTEVDIDGIDAYRLRFWRTA